MMRNRLIVILILTVVPMVAMGQREVSYIDSANLCRQREDWKGVEQWLKRGAKVGQTVCMNELGDFYSARKEYKKAAKWYAQAADPRANYNLAILYLNGSLDKHGETDSVHGVPLMRLSERAGYRDAIYMTARMFDAGAALPQSYDSAITMLHRLPSDGPALFMLARYHEEGYGVKVDSIKAMELFRSSGKAGYSDGYSYLGDYYMRGLAGIKPDSLQAFQTYMLAAGIPEDNANGLNDVAQCYLQGVGTRVDTAKAIYYLRDAVDAGSPVAAAELADMYNYGLGGLQANGDTALMLYHLASQSDEPRGDYMIGAYLYNQGLYESAMEYIQSAMMHGSFDAQVLFAQALLNGDGVEQNPTVAVEMLNELAPVDSKGQALLWLGIAYYTGTGVVTDVEKALQLIDSAASKGNMRAMLVMGQLYNGSEGIVRDTVKVVEWYNRAIAAGNVDAMIQLADGYQKGSLVPRDEKRAAELYQRAAELGSPEAMCRLGLCYEKGDGVILNSRHAYSLYQEAADRGSSFGMRLVAYCYAQGIYVDEDMKQAVEWFTRAAEAGDAHSAFILGQLYAIGEGGVKKSKKTARRWLTIAAEGGIAEAKDMLLSL
ncbi:MAG: sel1 repeat family protein [Bacteroidales bacterium]|nr:sel1 repeat family protein [Bacteroidales bacterium]